MHQQLHCLLTGLTASAAPWEANEGPACPEAFSIATTPFISWISSGNSPARDILHPSTMSSTLAPGPPGSPLDDLGAASPATVPSS
eukprot:CAMPEP_0117653844 /NCGR_PEP_ID=MMETSP0804-20121206/3417_1 /TAXON_ID=1074897 /ORGANISM="Tetraselmis astigmatica, Strain CCMP880" /LENGTH=85 /DNA_ID=CAMNT_0005460065 /DNA_START=66 /DNA_END=326 /DNA_ORIENTATION=+